jgi:hypothetical protein
VECALSLAELLLWARAMNAEEIVRCSMFNCRLSSVVALRASFLKNAAPKAHPNMTNDN